MASGQFSIASLESAAIAQRLDSDIRLLRSAVILLVSLCVSACAVPGSHREAGGSAAASPRHVYQASFHAVFHPRSGYADASIRITQQAGELRSLDLAAPASRYSEFKADGKLEQSRGRVLWEIPRTGGELHYRVVIDHKRRGGFDAKLTDRYAIFRLDDLFPRAKSRSLRGARAEATLSFDGPAGWSFETRYGPNSEAVAFENPERNFDRPTGWAIAGELGIRRSIIGEHRVAVAAPVGDDFRRMDILAFLRWTLPSVAAVFPQYPERTLIVGAGGDFWLGGLSGPGSLFIHSDRPMISENSTSSLLHELVHVATSSPPAAGDDWILEGIAEYYGLVLLQRSGGISNLRMTRAFADLAQWSSEDQGRLTDPSTGADTAHAAVMFLQLSEELAASGSSMDKLAARLFDGGAVDRQRLRSLADRLLGHPSAVLAEAYRELSAP